MTHPYFHLLLTDAVKMVLAESDSPDFEPSDIVEELVAVISDLTPDELIPLAQAIYEECAPELAKVNS